MVWSAKADSPVSLLGSNFVLDKDGNAYLKSAAGSVLWTANASNKGASMRLLDSGNLVVLGRDNTSASPLCSSFSNPTNTLVSGQVFVVGMALKNMAYRLEIKSRDMMMYYTGLERSQPYWSATTDIRTITGRKGDIYSVKLGLASWYFYDRSRSLVSQIFIPNDDGDAIANTNGTLTSVLGGEGSIAFSILQNGSGRSSHPKGIPLGSCDVPARCSPYSICIDGAGCQCSSALSSFPNCNPGIISPCCSRDEFQLAQLDDGVGYTGTRFALPVATNTNITGCKDACMNNCSCVAVVFNQGNCFLFDQISSFHMRNGRFFTSFVKVPRNNRGSAQGRRRTGITIVYVIGPLAFIGVLIYVGLCIYGRKTQGQAEEYGYLETIAGAPTQFTYRELQAATNNFCDKIGKGGFGSVYLGTLPDASCIAVKKLEGVGQGEKEFCSEVTIIGGIRHRHLMAKGSLHRCIFCTKEDDAPLLDWDTRFYIALGTAKGLAYLHQDCESKIIHCDVKTENVLVDDNFTAKVSDFGLAKLMSREQSHAFVMLRGTRGYLAPEWITNRAVSKKCDVYSYGMVLLEIISGRRNFHPMEVSEKAHFHPLLSRRWKKEDFCQRPSMSKVVQMLEGPCSSLKPDDVNAFLFVFAVTPT
ncbi:G-type lectin S-receptor-like serine/threonine-protein kinase SD2-5 [Triticum aestivum]|uniref:G-type lectin S-receptor-like serine/threonine-protein kinase SD2-5 n=1 Tax=Triticum aestivum TaxID=4565 RepID=UPI001D03357C|nr:G-type lectin S-receptor-like serine/threonine-protein kinase SD2-5 [Triticum aestivum]